MAKTFIRYRSGVARVWIISAVRSLRIVLVSVCFPMKTYRNSPYQAGISVHLIEHWKYEPSHTQQSSSRPTLSKLYFLKSHSFDLNFKNTS